MWKIQFTSNNSIYTKHTLSLPNSFPKCFCLAKIFEICIISCFEGLKHVELHVSSYFCLLVAKHFIGSFSSLQTIAKFFSAGIKMLWKIMMSCNFVVIVDINIFDWNWHCSRPQCQRSSERRIWPWNFKPIVSMSCCLHSNTRRKFSLI